MTILSLALLGAVVGAAAGAWLRRRRYLPLPRYPFRWWTVWLSAAASAAVFGLLGWRSDGTVQMLGVVFAAGAVVAVWTDLDGHRLPDWLTLPLAVALFVVIIGSGEWGRLASAAISAVVVWVVLWLMYRFGSLGGGDVKLGLSVGLVLGFLGPVQVFAGVLTGFLFAAVWAVILLARGRSKDSYLPLGPSLVFGVIACLLW